MTFKNNGLSYPFINHSLKGTKMDTKQFSLATLTVFAMAQLTALPLPAGYADMNMGGQEMGGQHGFSNQQTTPAGPNQISNRVSRRFSVSGSDAKTNLAEQMDPNPLSSETDFEDFESSEVESSETVSEDLEPSESSETSLEDFEDSESSDISFQSRENKKKGNGRKVKGRGEKKSKKSKIGRQKNKKERQAKHQRKKNERLSKQQSSSVKKGL